MRLTTRCLHHNRKMFYKITKGHQTTGKNRTPEIIKESERKKFIDGLQQESTNEMWLTRSYLKKNEEKLLKTSFKQASKGSQVFYKNAKDDWEVLNQRYRINVLPHVSFEERWTHLKTTEQWNRPENQAYRRTHQQYVEALKPKKYPDTWPRPVENWEEWNKIDGFGENKRPVHSATQTQSRLRNNGLDS